METASKKKLLSAVLAVNGLAVTGQLTIDQIVRAWESPEFRQTLSAEQLKQLPENPAGEIEFKMPSDSAPSFKIANTQYAGCDTQYAGCNTQYAGCDTQYAGCDTQYAGCSTQYASCMG